MTYSTAIGNPPSSLRAQVQLLKPDTDASPFQIAPRRKNTSLPRFASRAKNSSCSTIDANFESDGKTLVSVRAISEDGLTHQETYYGNGLIVSDTRRHLAENGSELLYQSRLFDHRGSLQVEYARCTRGSTHTYFRPDGSRELVTMFGADGTWIASLTF